MTEYALAPNRKFTGSNGTPSAMLAAGEVEAYRVRSNGTMRHLELYPLGSTAREAAEYVSDAIEYDGRSVANVARELHVSTPTVRRYLEGLELTEEVEAGDWDDLKFDSAGNPLWAQPTEDTEDDTVGDIVDLLDNAPKVVDLINANSQGTDVAPRPARTRKVRPAQTVQDVVVKQGLPFPTDEERAAALADVTPAPAATPQPEPARAAGGPLAMCFCGDQGVHAPGTQGCKNSPVPVRTRSHG